MTESIKQYEELKIHQNDAALAAVKAISDEIESFIKEMESVK